MMNELSILLRLLLAFLPFLLLLLALGKANVDRAIRHRQMLMPILAVVYSVVLFLFFNRINQAMMGQILQMTEDAQGGGAEAMLQDLAANHGAAVSLVAFNTLALLGFVILKLLLRILWNRLEIEPDTIRGELISLVYDHEAEDSAWYVRPAMGQARTFLKTAYCSGTVLAVLAMLISYRLAMDGRMAAPYYPVFAVLILGEAAYFVDGLRKDERDSSLTVAADQSTRFAAYALLRRPLRALLDDKLASEGTTVNHGAESGGSVEEILVSIEEAGDHLSRNYTAFIRKKMDGGLKPNMDYIRSGYDLSVGKSLLFNTPFYYKLQPYAFYAMHRHLLTGGKVLIVLGRHGTEEDLHRWCRKGMEDISNVPDLWRIQTLANRRQEEDQLPDIGILSCSGVHDLELHKVNLPFLKQVSFVVIVEPSRLVSTAQIGLHLLMKNCGKERSITYCSVDRNCDGLVDTLSHILMTNITEVSATEYPHGASSYMCWTADRDYVQHRIIPGVSRYLGMGTELSMIALKNQVRQTTWYGGEAYPVLDAHWIAKQYYHDLLQYAGLPSNQETFDKRFRASFNLCDQQVCDYAYVTVEDDRNNVFETRRNFATIAEQQGFVNVISSEYMLREYMTENPQVFTADAKAIPYVTADFARTARNTVLRLCLKLCIDGLTEDELRRELILLGLDAAEPDQTLWQQISTLFCDAEEIPTDHDGSPVICLKTHGMAEPLEFHRTETIVFRRRYSVELGKFESIYTIEAPAFAQHILEDLQNATYIAEQDEKDCFLGTELKGHIFQKYLPGQFFTLNGKYYEMVSVTTGNRILVRRAADHINGRAAYRQVRRYHMEKLHNSDAMGALKTINGMDLYYQFADFTVDTPAYWDLDAYNDFDSGALVEINGVPTRRYYNKQILRLDFSKLGEQFTDAIRTTITALLNEVFVTLFADNQPYISAVTPGDHDLPLTYSMTFRDGEQVNDRSIYIIEDSQLDLGLLIAVERNLQRILQILSDYLQWNEEQIEESRRPPEPPKAKAEFSPYDGSEEAVPEKQSRFGKWRNRRKKKSAEHEAAPAPEAQPTEEAPAAAEPEEEAASAPADTPEAPAAEPAAEALPASEEDEAAADTEQERDDTDAQSEEAAPAEEAAVEEAAEEAAAEETADEEPAEEPEDKAGKEGDSHAG